MKKHAGHYAVVLTSLIVMSCIIPSLANTPTPTHKPPPPAFTTGATTPIAAPEIQIDGSPFNLGWDTYAIFQQGLNPAYHGAMDSLRGATIYHMAFSFSDPPTRIRGVEQVRYTNQEEARLDQIVLALFPEILGGEIHIQQVRLEDEIVTPTQERGLLRIPLVAGLLPGESTYFEISFDIVVPSDGGNSYYGIFGYNDGILSLAHAYPTVLVFDQEGWNDRLPDLDGDPLFSDASFYLVTIDAPASLTLVASGHEIDRVVTGNRQQILYANGPARDFYLAASQNLNLHTRTENNVTIRSYTVPEAEEYSEQILDWAANALKVFGELFGPYPYTEFDIVPIQTSAGGVEYPGMTAVTLSIYNSYSQDFLELVVVHEIAHQWFYNLVGNDNQDQPWLDEALAEFLSWEYYRIQYGAEAAAAFEEEERNWWYSASNSDLVIGMPVFAYSSSDYGAIVYGKGPFFFDELRDRLGQDSFNSLMQEYVQNYQWAIAYSDGFAAMAEERCGCDLSDFFAAWIQP